MISEKPCCASLLAKHNNSICLSSYTISILIQTCIRSLIYICIYSNFDCNDAGKSEIMAKQDDWESKLSENDTYCQVSNMYCLPFCLWGNNWRASEASETLIGLNNGNRRYIYICIYST